MTDRLISLAFVALLLLILATALDMLTVPDLETIWTQDRFTRFDAVRDRGTP